MLRTTPLSRVRSSVPPARATGTLNVRVMSMGEPAAYDALGVEDVIDEIFGVPPKPGSSNNAVLSSSLS